MFRYLDKEEFAACNYCYSEKFLNLFAGGLISIDGKVLQGTAKKGQRKNGICIKRTISTASKNEEKAGWIDSCLLQILDTGFLSAFNLFFN